MHSLNKNNHAIPFRRNLYRFGTVSSLMTYVRRCGLLLQTEYSVVCLSVCHSRELCKTAESIKMPFGLWTQAGPMYHALGGGPGAAYYHHHHLLLRQKAAHKH